MKSAFRLVPVFALVLAVAAQGQILNSKHDLSIGSTGPDAANLIAGMDQICVPCHTPHWADTTVGEAPLWNHALTSQTFQMYTTLQGRTGNTTPDGASKLCLSCHDGVTAMDNYGGATTGIQAMTDPGGVGVGGDPVVGLDLRNDHPIGLTYPPPSGLYESTVNVIAAGLRLPNDGTNDRIECQSCHDPHLTTNTYFLRLSNTNSNLCRTCHLL